jgi:hypothetical protein
MVVSASNVVSPSTTKVLVPVMGDVARNPPAALIWPTTLRVLETLRVLTRRLLNFVAPVTERVLPRVVAAVE